jgi:hypothetical protein
MKQLINILTGQAIQEGELEGGWQKFVLERLETIDIDSEDIEAQFVSYNRGFIDGMKMAMKLDGSMIGKASRYQVQKSDK